MPICMCFQTSLFNKESSRIGLRPRLDYICKDPISKKGHISRYQWLGLRWSFQGNTTQSVTSIQLFPGFCYWCGVFHSGGACVLSPGWLFATWWSRLPGSSSRGIVQARILEWVAISSSRGSSWPRDWRCISFVSCVGRQILYHWATWEGWWWY